MAKCEKCKMKIPDDAEVCPYCGNRTSYGRINNGLTTILAYVFIIGLAISWLKSCFS